MGLADITEATAETTSTEINEFVDQLVKDVERDRKGEPEPKSDAQITNEQADIDQPGSKSPAEKNSSGDTATLGEETGDELEADWLTDDVKAEAAAYGINEAELSEFTSREEFSKALRLFDKAALDAGRKAMAASEPARNEKGQFAKKEEPKAEQDKAKANAPKEGSYKVSLNPDLYDEEIIGELSRMAAHYESRLELLESHFSQVQASEEERRFDNFVDSLGHSDLFGVTGKESEKELERRRDLNVAVKAQMIGLAQMGRPAEMSQQLISRVANMVFGEELGKKLLKQRTKSISRQSNGRMGGSPTKPLPPSEDPRDQFDRMYKEMANK